MKMIELKKRMVRETLALDSLNKGNRQPAIDEIMLGDLSDEQLRYGLTERLKHSYAVCSGTRTAALGSALNVLSGGRLPESAISALNFFLRPKS